MELHILGHIRRRQLYASLGILYTTRNCTSLLVKEELAFFRNPNSCVQSLDMLMYLNLLGHAFLRAALDPLNGNRISPRLPILIFGAIFGFFGSSEPSIRLIIRKLLRLP